MQRVAIVALDGRPGYEVRLCGLRRRVEAGGLHLEVGHGLDELARADTIVLPGLRDPDAPVPEALLRAVREAAAAGARVASICSGAFLLAATGLLDGRRATTHWLGCEELARRHPRARVDPDVLYVDEGRVLTSAGAGAAAPRPGAARDHAPSGSSASPAARASGRPPHSATAFGASSARAPRRTGAPSTAGRSFSALSRQGLGRPGGGGRDAAADSIRGRSAYMAAASSPFASSSNWVAILSLSWAICSQCSFMSWAFFSLP